ncbi:Na+/H+ antiporter subunit E [Streptomyces nanhaiensis]|uniref:Na+/H+ antiporter subunit E n=1 Tax=Streptomyces nanhaiensis TaxID=679319 RepID=UPI00399D0544
MSPADEREHGTAGTREARGGPPRRTSRQWPLALWLWVLWIVLWGSVSPVVLVGGAVVALLVVVLFPLPSIARRARPHPLWLLLLPAHLLVGLVGSAVAVALEAVRRGPRVRAAVLEVPLRSESDLMIAATASMASLTPGTLVLEIDRDRRRLYVHALPARDAQEVERRRGEVATAERWVMRTIGPAGMRKDPDRRERGYGGEEERG